MHASVSLILAHINDSHDALMAALSEMGKVNMNGANKKTVTFFKGALTRPARCGKQFECIVQRCERRRWKLQKIR